MTSLNQYAQVVGDDVIDQLKQLAESLKGKRIVHINSTTVGGGVAEILSKLVPLTQELGVDTTWEVIQGDEDFFLCTKQIHNAMQGKPVLVTDALFKHYQDVNAHNAERLQATLTDADFVFVHDPQPAPLLKFTPQRQGRWIWRCHIDASHPYRPVWKFLQPYVAGYDASIFSLAAFAQRLAHRQYVIPPSIDPLSDKNRELPPQEIAHIFDRFHLDSDRPLMVQISRFDRFKDPIGVIEAYKLATKFIPKLQLVIAGGSATDDPEGANILTEVQAAANDDNDIHILSLPANAHLTVNALQRAADIIIQKSIREGFGLTVTEGLWKGKPVIGGDTGGIRRQVVNYHTGFLVNTPEGAALRIRYLLNQPEVIRTMGRKAKAYVHENFLLTRQLREYLTLMVALLNPQANRIELG